MSELLSKVVVSACRDAGLSVIYDPQQDVVVLPIQLEDALVMMMVRANDETAQVTVSIPGLLTVTEPRRRALADEVSRWNFDHLPMMLAMDPEDGELRAALVVDLRGVQHRELAFAGSLTRLVAAVDSVYPSLARLRWTGRTPRSIGSQVARQVAEILRRSGGQLPEPPAPQPKE
ncbi:MAG: hypothetical protein NTZ05_10750 [Chloroflexi bacterium]|nr:hypothetical protein [Chloroflexota bacterium]